MRPAAFADLGVTLVVVEVNIHEKGEAGVTSLGCSVTWSLCE